MYGLWATGVDLAHRFPLIHSEQHCVAYPPAGVVIIGRVGPSCRIYGAALTQLEEGVMWWQVALWGNERSEQGNDRIHG